MMPVETGEFDCCGPVRECPPQPINTTPMLQVTGEPTVSPITNEPTKDPTVSPINELTAESAANHKCNEESCATEAASIGLPFISVHKSNGAPAGCVKYRDRVTFVQTCNNHPNCGTTTCNGCEVLCTPKIEEYTWVLGDYPKDCERCGFHEYTLTKTLKCQNIQTGDAVSFTYCDASEKPVQPTKTCPTTHRCRTAKVCYKDGCKGTRTNSIPNGERWVKKQKGHVSSTGCCTFGWGACDLCSEPWYQ